MSQHLIITSKWLPSGLQS